MSDEIVDTSTEEREFSLDELSKLADISPRTVRYYIVEGLLPPPLTTGRNATYSQEHLDRLNAIAALKEMFLPLREIRYRLNTLTPEQMRDPAYLATLSQAIAMERAMGKRHGRPERREMSARMGENAAKHMWREEMRRDHRDHPRHPEPSLAMRATLAEDPAVQTSQSWERFPLGDDAELLIRSSRALTMGPNLHRMLHRLRHMIENDQDDNERNR